MSQSSLRRLSAVFALGLLQSLVVGVLYWVFSVELPTWLYIANGAVIKTRG